MTVTINHKGSVLLGYIDRCNDITCECHIGFTVFPESSTFPPRVDAAFNHPDPYGGDTVYEVIKVLEAWGILDFCLGNAIKYISRAGKKDGAKEIEDLEKASWYIRRRIEQLQVARDKAIKVASKGACNAN